MNGALFELGPEEGFFWRERGETPVLLSNSFFRPLRRVARAFSPCCTGKMPELPFFGKKFSCRGSKLGQRPQAFGLVNRIGKYGQAQGQQDRGKYAQDGYLGG
jgi:hypothetical protein